MLHIVVLDHPGGYQRFVDAEFGEVKWTHLENVDDVVRETPGWWDEYG
jgi:hypothetical protein